jgi:hypothetical protein
VIEAVEQALQQVHPVEDWHAEQGQGLQGAGGRRGAVEAVEQLPVALDQGAVAAGVGVLHQAIPELGLAQLAALGPGGQLQSKSPQPLQQQGAGGGVVVGREGGREGLLQLAQAGLGRVQD